MPVPIAGILIGVIIAAVFRILLALGIGFVAFTVALPNMYTFIQGYFNGMPPDYLSIVGMLKIDIAITMILSAAAARMAYKIAATPLVSLG